MNGSPNSDDDEAADVDADAGLQLVSPYCGCWRAEYINNPMGGSLFYIGGNRLKKLSNLAKVTWLVSDRVRILCSKHEYLIN